MTTEELDARMASLREELRAELAAQARPVSLSPERACELFGFGRSVFFDWLADAKSGLLDGAEPVVWRPNGRGGKVLVHVARMEAWLDARGRGRRGRTA